MSALAAGLLVAAGLAAIALAFVRLLRGPTAADRVIALDVVFAASVACATAAALVTGRMLFLDVGLGLAVVGFVTTIAWARLVELEDEPAPDDRAAPGGEAP